MRLLLNVDHPEFEVHNFFSLAKSIGYHPTLLQQLYRNEKMEVLAFRHTSHKNIFVISKSEIERLKARYGAYHKRLADWKQIREDKANAPKPPPSKDSSKKRSRKGQSMEKQKV